MTFNMFPDIPQIEDNEITSELAPVPQWKDCDAPFMDFENGCPDEMALYTIFSGMDCPTGVMTMEANPIWDSAPAHTYWEPRTIRSQPPELPQVDALDVQWIAPSMKPLSLPSLAPDDSSSGDESSAESLTNSIAYDSPPESSFPGAGFASACRPYTDGQRPFESGAIPFNHGVQLQDIQPWDESYGEVQEHASGFEDSSPQPPFFSMGYSGPMEREDSDKGKGPMDSNNRDPACRDESPAESELLSDIDYTPRRENTRGKVAAPSKTKQKNLRVHNKTRSTPGKVYKKTASEKKTIEIVSSGASSKMACPECSSVLSNQSQLQKHIAVSHTRPFKCTFSLYRCTSTFGSKNEWKRHVMSQHLRLGVWRCDLDGCVPLGMPSSPASICSPPSSAAEWASPAREGSQEAEDEVEYNEFNRKDLFTQHLKRMHMDEMPAHAQRTSDRAAMAVWLRETSKRCFNYVRGPPPRSECGYCAGGASRAIVFHGPSGWEQRMEHVGKHLEAGRLADSDWVEDVGLRDWLCNEGLLEPCPQGGWQLSAAGGGGNPSRARLTGAATGDALYVVIATWPPCVPARNGPFCIYVLNDGSAGHIKEWLGWKWYGRMASGRSRAPSRAKNKREEI